MLSSLLLPLVLAPFTAPPADLSGSAVEDSSGGWIDLDQDLDLLAGSTALGPGDAIGVHWLARGFYEHSDSNIATGGGGVDGHSGVLMTEVDLALDYNSEAWSGRVSVDLDTPGGVIEDAWVAYRWSPQLRLRIGHFKANVSRTNEADPENLAFRSRSFIGSAFDTWDQGVELSGDWEEWDWWLAYMNGADGPAYRGMYVARFEWPFYGAAFAPGESARQAPDLMRTSIGGTYLSYNNSGTDRSDMWGLDLQGTVGPWGYGGEWFVLGNQTALTANTTGDLLLAHAGDGHPFDVYLTRMFGERWQAGGRYQSFDDNLDTDVWGGTLNFFPNEGPVAFLIDVQDVHSDGLEGWALSLGFSAGQSR